MGAIVANGEVLAQLRSQLDRVHGLRMDAPVLPAPPALASLLPGRGFRPGASYSVGMGMSLLYALLAQPSADGSWCAVVGVPHFGAEAAERAGVSLSRVVLVPDPGQRWLAVAATVADVVPVVVIRPPSQARDADASRLAARMRDRGAVLFVQGPWPQAEAVIDVTRSRWSGLGDGDGYLATREVTVSVSSRRFPRAREGRMLLPAADGAATSLPGTPGGSRERFMQAVG